MSVSDRESVPSPGFHPWRWPVGFFLRRSDRGRVSSQKLGDGCASAPNLQADPMPPRMIQESCRPRVSDRTMVGNSATRLACEFQRTEWCRHERKNETTETKKHPRPVAPWLTRPLRDQPKRSSGKEEVSLIWRGLDVRKYFWRPGGEKCFLLDIPLNRTSGSTAWAGRRRRLNFRVPRRSPNVKIR